MTISEMHSFWIDDCEPSKKTITEWTKAKNRFVDIFGDVKLTGVTRTHAHQFRAALRKLPKRPKQEIAKDRKSVVKGKGVSVRVDPGGRGTCKKNKEN